MHWIERISGLQELPEELQSRLLAQSKVVNLPEGEVIFGPGQMPQNLLLLLEGTIRVQHLSAEGREIVLFRVSGGDSCILTTACLLAYEDYAAEGIAENPAKIRSSVTSSPRR